MGLDVKTKAYVMNVNTWIDKEYKMLSRLAKNWSNDNWRDLITHYYMYLSRPKNWEKFKPLPEEDKIKFTQKWMGNSVKWTNSEFSKSLRVNNLEDEYDIEETTYECETSLYVSAEDIDESVKEWLVDLHNNWGDEQIHRIVKVREMYLSKMKTEDRVLYDLTYNQQLTLRDISKKINIPLTSVFLMVKNLNEKIKLEVCGTQSIN